MNGQIKHIIKMPSRSNRSSSPQARKPSFWFQNQVIISLNEIFQGQPNVQFALEYSEEKKIKLLRFLSSFNKDQWIQGCHRSLVNGEIDYFMRTETKKLEGIFQNAEMPLRNIYRGKEISGEISVMVEIKEGLKLVRPEQLIRNSMGLRSIQKTDQIIIVLISDQTIFQFNKDIINLIKQFSNKNWMDWGICSIFACYKKSMIRCVYQGLKGLGKLQKEIETIKNDMITFKEQIIACIKSQKQGAQIHQEQEKEQEKPQKSKKQQRKEKKKKQSQKIKELQVVQREEQDTTEVKYKRCMIVAIFILVGLLAIALVATRK